MKTLEQIAAELQGYDPQALRAADVNQFLARLVEPVTQTESVGVFAALDRVLAQDVMSPISVPPHDNSAMDGFALDGAQLQPGAPLTLKIVGTALAGKAWPGTVGPGECVKIMTGAITVHIPIGVLQRGDNRRLLGEDLMAGRPALAAGTRIGPAACGLLASLGVGTVPVFRRLRVAYFSTGDEILSIGEAPREGAVYDSNRYTVFGLLTRLGCDVIDLGVVRDEPALLEAAFTQAAAQADAIITSGGEADFTKTMMKQFGDVAFWRIAMRPGRPMAVGRISGTKMASTQLGAATASSHFDSRSATVETRHLGQTIPRDAGETRDKDTPGAILFGLPGNPVAVMVTFLAFVRPALLRMMGCTTPAPPLLRAVSQEALRKKPGRTEYQRGIVSTAPDGTLQVRTTGNQGSGVLSSMVQGNGLIVLHHEQGHVAAGDPVDVMMFDGMI
jgi:molybdopterin molybdotransferase